MVGLRVARELFVIPEDDGRFKLYAPLQGVLMRVNDGTVSLLQKVQRGEKIGKRDQSVLRQLTEKRVLTASEDSSVCKNNPDEKYEPTSVTLLPTYNCNLRCLYCYSRGGENVGEEDVGRVMDFGVAKAGIDFIIKNARERKQKWVGLGFHGGGEPLLHQNIPLVKKIIKYFKQTTDENKTTGVVSVVTNGVIRNREDLEWIVGNFDRLAVSLDGPEDIQTEQRPIAGGESSFAYVLTTIRELETHKKEYGIRATITAESVARIPEIVEFFAKVAPSVKEFHLEPLFQCGRCETTGAETPSPEDFIKYFIKARETADKLGVSVYYSGSGIGRLGNGFCGANGKNFFITPTGDVTTCLEVSRRNSPLISLFFIGKYNADKDCFEFDKAKLARLRTRTIENMPYCSDCFAKFNCGGYCSAKVMQNSGDMFDPSKSPACYVNRKLINHELDQRLLKGGERNG